MIKLLLTGFSSVMLLHETVKKTLFVKVKLWLLLQLITQLQSKKCDTETKLQRYYCITKELAYRGNGFPVKNHFWKTEVFLLFLFFFIYIFLTFFEFEPIISFLQFYY